MPCCMLGCSRIESAQWGMLLSLTRHRREVTSVLLRFVKFLSSRWPMESGEQSRALVIGSHGNGFGCSFDPLYCKKNHLWQLPVYILCFLIIWNLFIIKIEYLIIATTLIFFDLNQTAENQEILFPKEIVNKTSQKACWISAKLRTSPSRNERVYAFMLFVNPVVCFYGYCSFAP